MINNTLFLIRHKKQITTCKLRLGVITENIYLLQGLLLMVESTAALSDAIEVMSLSAKKWLYFPHYCDVLITDRKIKNGISLLPINFLPTVPLFGCDVKPDSLFSILYQLLNNSTQLRWYPIPRKKTLTYRERELLAFFLKGMAIKEIVSTGRFTFKVLSLYKNNIKQKTGCNRDADLFSAMIFVRYITSTRQSVMSADDSY